jgi:hypothetical protein
VRQLGAQAKATFDRLFPERQIIQRSCGAVRGLKLSPRRQAIAALGAVGLAGWCVYASASTVLEGPTPPAVAGFPSERAKYERWLDDFRGRASAAREMLQQTTAEFENARRSIDTRHDTLRALLEYAQGSRLRVRRGDGGAVVMLSAVRSSEPGAAPEARRAELVSLRGRDWSARLKGALGPASAEAAPLAEAANENTLDFAAYVRDPRLTDRVGRVAGRVSAFRRLTHY